MHERALLRAFPTWKMATSNRLYRPIKLVPCYTSRFLIDSSSSTEFRLLTKTQNTNFNSHLSRGLSETYITYTLATNYPPANLSPLHATSAITALTCPSSYTTLVYLERLSQIARASISSFVISDKRQVRVFLLPDALERGYLVTDPVLSVKRRPNFPSARALARARTWNQRMSVFSRLLLARVARVGVYVRTYVCARACGRTSARKRSSLVMD